MYAFVFVAGFVLFVAMAGCAWYLIAQAPKTAGYPDGINGTRGASYPVAYGFSVASDSGCRGGDAGGGASGCS